MSQEPVAVRILDREFLVACEPHERADLLDAARHLDDKMRDVRGQSRAPGFDRVAILAALGISHELLAEKRRAATESSAVADKLRTLQVKLEHALV